MSNPISERADRAALPKSPLKPLGHIGSRFFVYIVTRTQQIVQLSPTQHSAASLRSAGSEGEWSAAFPTHKRRQGRTVVIDWASIAEELQRQCHEAGEYDPSLARGKGAWRDAGRVVYNAGQQLFVSGQRTEFDQIESNYYYEKHGSGTLPADEPLSAEQADTIRQLLERWRWHGGSIAALLALGWIAVAPICGALPWRPHIWITGSRSTGKSTLASVIQSLIGPVAQTMQGSTTEAGLRQSLNGNAPPVIFDEFEADAKDADGIIAAARVAASDNIARVVKGTVEGKPLLYRLRFSALLLGINANLKNDADRSRFILLELDAGSWSAEDRVALQHAIASLNKGITAKLLRRMIDKLDSGAFDVALHAFTSAIIGAGGDIRMADVLATLLAGAWCATRDRPPTADEAASLAAQAIAIGEEGSSDAEECLHHLLGHRVNLGSGDVRTLGECIGEADDEHVGNVLARHGIRVDRSVVYVANTAAGIKALYASTRWKDGSHSRQLRRLGGARAVPNPMKFAGQQSRATELPLERVLGGAGTADPP